MAGMYRLIFLCFLLLFATVPAAEEKSRSACEEEAYKYYPDPNFTPQPGGAGLYGGQGGRTDFTTSVPSASDYERARKNRERYIEECMAGGGKEE